MILEGLGKGQPHKGQGEHKRVEDENFVGWPFPDVFPGPLAATTSRGKDGRLKIHFQTVSPERTGEESRK